MSSSNVILIDNYDSFTWNIYELLRREGAQVSVYRNDEINVEQITALEPTHIVISPGPGNPEEDSGVSRDVINHFMGKIPIFGICMGLQCIVSMLGGKVESAGEIFHGKTSLISHKNIGCFKGISQGISATRYHSLAANFEKLPSCLEITATLENSGIIQGIRHRKYTVEGVQFHPESILTQEGRLMLRNFLSYAGGTWEDSRNVPNPGHTSSGSLLEKIYAQRRIDVATQERIMGQSLESLELSLAMGLAPKLIDFRQKLVSIGVPTKTALIAEIKRASPSKGSIAPQIHAPSQAIEYTEAGACAISVLTEPTWFKGTIDDLIEVRRALERYGNDRPAVLRKDFIFSCYQIAETRLAGADTVLLIVKMLNDRELQTLYEYSRKLGMEPLVEVSSALEMKRALILGARIIGINNRDLHSFEVDLSTTTNLLSDVKDSDTILVALSGITCPDQVDMYASQGVKAVLVGESLMRAENTKEFARSLINRDRA